MAINTCFFGVNVTLKQREVLDREARRRGITRNMLIRQFADELEAKTREQTCV